MPDESVLVENVVASHLSRKIDAFYWKNQRETDLVIRSEEIIGFEVRWSEKLGDFSKIKIGKMKNVFCLTKDLIDKEKNLLPISLFLAVL